LDDLAEHVLVIHIHLVINRVQYRVMPLFQTQIVPSFGQPIPILLLVYFHLLLKSALQVLPANVGQFGLLLLVVFCLAEVGLVVGDFILVPGLLEDLLDLHIVDVLPFHLSLVVLGLLIKLH